MIHEGRHFGRLGVRGGSTMQQRLWSRDLVFDIGVNFLIYSVHFLLMLWSASYVLDRWQVSLGMAGAASGIFIIGALLARIPAGRYIDFIGRRRLFCTSVFLFFIGSLLYPYADSVGTFLAVRFIHGMAFGAVSTAAMTAAASLLPPERIGKGIGYFNLGVTVASAVGPFLAMRFIHLEELMDSAYIAAAASAALVYLAIWAKIPERVPTKAEKREIKKKDFSDFFVVRALNIGVIVFLAGMCYSSVLAFLWEYASGLGFEKTGGVYFFVCFAFAAFVGRSATGWLMDHQGRDTVIYLSLLLVVIGMIAVAVASESGLFLIGGLVLGAGYGTVTSTCHALSLSCAVAGKLGLATSTYFVMMDLGIGIGPFLAGILAETFGFQTAYLAMGALALFGIDFYYIQLGKSGRLAADRMVEIREHIRQAQQGK